MIPGLGIWAVDKPAPRFLGLTQTAFGVLAAFADGRVAVLENGRANGNARIGLVFRPIAHADYDDLFPPAAPVADLPEPSDAHPLTMADFRAAMLPVADLPDLRDDLDPTLR